MSALTRRALMACLVAVGSGPALAATPGGLPALDPAAAKRIGQTWLAAHPTTRAALERGLFPRGGADVAALRARIAADFRGGRIFDYQGWRLSQTEARLFALYGFS